MFKVAGSISIVLPNLCGGGAERVAVNLANGFIRRGFAVEMILLSATGVFLADLHPNIQVVDLKILRLRSALLPLVQYLRRSRPDALLAFMWPLTVIALWACWLARTDTRIVVTEHTTWSRDEIVSSFCARWLVRSTMHFSFRYADVVIAVSKGAADDLARFARLDREKIHVVYNPVVGENQTNTDVLQAPEGWWFGQHRRVLAVGALKPIKDYVTLLSAFADLCKRIDARILILGDGVCRAELEALIKNLGLENSVFMPGFVKNLTPYYQRADLHVLTSSGEGFGNVIVEALAAGTPVVSTDCQSGPREILADGCFGTLVPVGDVVAIANAMAESLAIEHNSCDLIARAKVFSVDKAVDEYLKLLLPSSSSEGET